MDYTEKSILELNAKSVAGYKNIKETLKKAAKLKPQKLDALMLKLHQDEFSKINCLNCALCCKGIGPAIYRSDIKRMAAAIKLSVPEFTDRYLMQDTDEQFSFNQAPCPFLGSDNYCAVYNARPKACREYPHTDRKRFYQILTLTAKNARVCPAVFNIITRLRSEI